MTRFAVVGAGWRLGAYLRAAAAVPDRLALSAVVARRPERRERLLAEGLFAVATLDEALATRPDFVVTSVGWADNPGLLRELAGRGFPVLSETPPAPDDAELDAIRDLAGRVQVAEQYPSQPMHAARIALARSGRLGEITSAQQSAAHGYHGVALLRAFLGLAGEGVEIRAVRHESPILESPGRDGPPDGDRTVPSSRTVATLHFENGRLGTFDFSGDQYFSFVRATSVALRGTRGEVADDDVRWALDPRTPRSGRLVRRSAGGPGNLEGLGLRSVTLGDEELWRAPNGDLRLADDELAVLDLLLGTAAHVRDDGPAPYPLLAAIRDHRIGMAIDRAARSGETVVLPAEVVD